MQLSVSILSLAAVTRAAVIGRAPAVSGHPPPPGPYTLGAWLPEFFDVDGVQHRPWRGTAINANGGKFYIGKAPSAYCPSDVEGLDCSKYSGDATWVNGGVYEGRNGTLSLYVGVPGGQQIYIAPDGSLSYTTAHSASIPEGSLTEGWTRQTSVTFGAPVHVSYSTGDALLASAMCKIEGGADVWQLFMTSFVNIPSNCRSVSLRTYSQCCQSPFNPTAWQY